MERDIYAMEEVVRNVVVVSHKPAETNADMV